MEKWRIEFDGNVYYVLIKRWLFWSYIKGSHQGGGYGPVPFSSLRDAVEFINNEIKRAEERKKPKYLKI